MTQTPAVFHRLRPTWTSQFGQVIDLLHQDPINHFSKEFPHLMSMIVERGRGAARVATPTTPALPRPATASAVVLVLGAVVLGAAGCAATDAAPTPATTVAASGAPSTPAWQDHAS